MKFNPKLRQDVGKYKDYVIIVEGKKDVLALNGLGFEKVYAVHKTGMALRERVEEIVAELDKKDKVCILTDLDKKGKKVKKRALQGITVGVVHIKATFNNTLIIITDKQGNTIVWSSPGRVGFSGSKKSYTYRAANIVTMTTAVPRTRNIPP